MTRTLLSKSLGFWFSASIQNLNFRYTSRFFGLPISDFFDYWDTNVLAISNLKLQIAVLLSEGCLSLTF